MRAGTTIIFLCLLLFCEAAVAHNVSENNTRFIENLSGQAVVQFMYLGAKRMLTGLDHPLYLVGILFFLNQTRDILIYATYFTLGQSLTLASGVIQGVGASPFIIDAIIGLSIVYKAFENLDGFQEVLGFSFNPLAAVFVFGLAHDLGLATKLQSIAPRNDALLTNILSFNIGVELGQFFALFLMLVAAIFLRSRGAAGCYKFVINTALMTAGLTLAGYHLIGFVQL